MRIRASALVLGLVGLLACGGSEEQVKAPDPVAAPSAADASKRAAWAQSQGLKLKQFDLNRDGAPDVFKFYRLEDDPKNPGNKLERLVRKEIDINFDTRVDIIRLYNDQNQVVEERTDLDFDGRIDEVTHFEAGTVVRKEIDLDYDSESDIIKYYEGGKLTRIESDRNDDGQVDTWEYFVNGELDRIGTDTDRDGKVDDWERTSVAGVEGPVDKEEQ